MCRGGSARRLSGSASSTLRVRYWRASDERLDATPISRRCSDGGLWRTARWNSWRPAAHPSMRWVSRATSSGDSRSPHTSLRRRSASQVRKRRSSGPISSSSPVSRKPGDVERRHRARADRETDVIGRVDDEPGDRGLGRPAADLVEVVDHDHDRAAVDRLEAVDGVVDRQPTGDLEIERASPSRGRDGRRTARRSRRADPCAARSWWHR